MSALVALTAFGFTIPSLVISTNAAADTLQMSSDNLETGWYPNEPQLAPSAVTGGNFGQLFNTQLTGQVYAQPLVAQPTVLAVTEKDYAYGLDSTTGAITWQRNFGPPADPLVQTNCGDIGANMGITGTPVIDSSGIAYFVAATGTGAGGATQYFMDAVNVQTGVTPAG
jgi:iron transport multicopper oxidase